MQKSLLSPSWYRVAGLAPRLRPHVRITRQTFRGTLWYVLEDAAHNRFHRFSPAAHAAIALMDGTRTVEEIWRTLHSLGEELPTQDEVIHLLAQLDGADLLATDRRPDLGELSDRSARQARRQLWQKFYNPLYLRLPLLDPDRFLERTVGIVRPLWSVWGVLLWLCVVGWGAVHAGLNWTALTHDLADHVLARDNLVILALTFPVLKAIHELGHGYATKIHGGQVHEAGIMTLILMPVPYVDVSTSTGFGSKWQRALVGAAGMLVELFCAGLAMMVWTSVEPGLLRAAAFNVLLVAGVSTLIFNGNPLLRFDAYYILSDLIEIPNLAARATLYYRYLMNRRLFGVAGQVSPARTPGEAAWFAAYAPVSYVYRLSVMFSIALFVSTKLYGLGAALALWTVVTGVVLPAGRALFYLFRSPVLRPRRLRALAVCGSAAAVVALVLFALPLPYGTVTEGVVWSPQGADVHAGAEGVIEALLAVPDGLVDAQAPLATLRDPLLEARVTLLEAQLREVRLRYAAVEYSDQVQAQMLRQQVAYFATELADSRQRRSELEVKSPSDGRFLVRAPQDLTGRFVRRGELLGYVVGDHAASVRVIVPQAEIELVREGTQGVGLRFASDPSTAYAVPAVSREVPTATRELPSMALATIGGGTIPLDPADDKHQRALEVVFQLDVPLPPELAVARIGERVHVRFDHGAHTLGWRLGRSIRQAFLRHFQS